MVVDHVVLRSDLPCLTVFPLQDQPSFVVVPGGSLRDPSQAALTAAQVSLGNYVGHAILCHRSCRCSAHMYIVACV